MDGITVNPPMGEGGGQGLAWVGVVSIETACLPPVSPPGRWHEGQLLTFRWCAGRDRGGRQ